MINEHMGRLDEGERKTLLDLLKKLGGKDDK